MRYNKKKVSEYLNEKLAIKKIFNLISSAVLKNLYKNNSKKYY